MVAVVREGQACIDCTMVIANADTSGISELKEWEKAVSATNPTQNGKYQIVMTCGEECEGESRDGSCDYCGRSLGYAEFHPIAFLA